MSQITLGEVLTAIGIVVQVAKLVLDIVKLVRESRNSSNKQD